MAGGQGFVASQGSIGRAVTVALVGVAIAASAGNVATDSPDRTVGLNGLAVAAAQGDLRTGRGLEFVSALGSVDNATAVALSGQVVSGDQGSIAVQGGSPDRTAELLGQAASVQQGNMVGEEYSDMYVSLAQGAVDNLTSVALLGQFVSCTAGALGAIGAPVTVDLVGGQATADIGTVGVQRREGVSGESVQVQSGTMAAEAVSNVIAALTGQAMAAATGKVLVISNLSRMGRWRGDRRIDSMPRTGVRNTKRTWR